MTFIILFLLGDILGIWMIVNRRPWHSEKMWWRIFSPIMVSILFLDAIKCLVLLVKG